MSLLFLSLLFSFVLLSFGKPQSSPNSEEENLKVAVQHALINYASNENLNLNLPINENTKLTYAGGSSTTYNFNVEGGSSVVPYAHSNDKSTIQPFIIDLENPSSSVHSNVYKPSPHSYVCRYDVILRLITCKIVIEEKDTPQIIPVIPIYPIIPLASVL